MHLAALIAKNIMAKLVPVYRVVTYILVAFAAVMCIVALFALLVSFANPSMFLPVFMLAGVIIYTFTSFYFDRKGIQKGIACKPSLRDWIRVNAFVTIAFSVTTLIDSINFLSHPALINDFSKQMMKSQPSYASAGITQAYLVHFLKTAFYIICSYCVLLLLHVAATFTLLKRYRYLFGKKDGRQP